MRIALAPGVSTPRRGERRAVRQLVRGEARVPLERSTLRVVAANRERGQYREKSGKETKTRSFQTPVQSIVLYEQFLPHVQQFFEPFPDDFISLKPCFGIRRIICSWPVSHQTSAVISA